MHVARLMPKKTPATCVVLVLARLPGPGVSAVLRAPYTQFPCTRNTRVTGTALAATHLRIGHLCLSRAAYIAYIA